MSISPSMDPEDRAMDIRLNAMSHIMYKIGKTFNLVVHCGLFCQIWQYCAE